MSGTHESHRLCRCARPDGWSGSTGAPSRPPLERNEDGGVDVVLEGIEITVERSENPRALIARMHDLRLG